MSSPTPRPTRHLQLEVPDYVVVIVAELERSVGFYVDLLGLKLQHRSGPFVQLDTGRTRLALYQRDAMAETLGVEKLAAPDPHAPGFELGFKVADVDSVYAVLVARGVQPAVPPTDRHWGQRTAYVRDPDGYLIELATDLGRPAGVTSP
ncbi:MAG: VOC family protein [Nitriliruptorales bacterium]